MKTRPLLAACALPLLLFSGCGYHLGGLRCAALKNKETFCVNMFQNYTTQPNAAILMTTALADNLQRDGSFRMAAPEDCDFRIDGAVTRILHHSLTANSRDSYISSEIGLRVYVDYVVTDSATGKVLISGTTKAEGSYFNTTTGNVQTARESAISYATRKVAEDIVYRLTIP